jgi:putative endonuclease
MLKHNLRNLVRRLFPPKSLGQRGEAAAARYLCRRGYKILARGDRFGPGELDLVALDRETIVFVEVKTRQSHEAGHPAEAVDGPKQRRLTRLAVTFLKRHGLLECPARFDVIAVTWPAGRRRPAIEHVENAFGAAGQWEFSSWPFQAGSLLSPAATGMVPRSIRGLTDDARSATLTGQLWELRHNSLSHPYLGL